jgi:redox-sensitive bicupin YhaK (pirin superfamily)
MITGRQAHERGTTQTPWLDSHHTFSFHRYDDPRYTGFRDLLVINEDSVAPGMGFGTHGHQNIEIISYVVEGQLAHKDSTGVSSIMYPGDVQRMSAGTGVCHSEFNPSATEPTHFLQVWMQPEQQGLPPSDEQRAFPEADRRGTLRLLASRDGQDGSVPDRAPPTASSPSTCVNASTGAVATTVAVRCSAQAGSMRHSGCRSVSLGKSSLERKKRTKTRGGMEELYTCKGGVDGDLDPWA